MANSMATLSRRLYHSLLSNSRLSQISMPFCTTNLSSREDSDSDKSALNLDTDSLSESAPQSSSTTTTEPRKLFDNQLQNGLDVGIYKAILVGKVGQTPLQKTLRNGKMLTLLVLGTGGIRNNRRPFEDEEPRDYANRCNVQWHRVAVYPVGLGELVMKHVVPGSIIYLEGNLETKIFPDPITGRVRRIREIAIRRNGRLLLLGGGGDDQAASPSELKSVGYY